ncbi:TAXI family TRAP transporter solute-binding subunit [Actinokineospora bangkokensis]|uniref:C4-dicarboxylate ABC transporter substrate-binding protein n=1 Tax=Actinokineospora bangkokensis TaxID=1193682 RepID=A0A1Q9LT53_9PSEU|nr:TAXI family TRAP transporter solute-binding subunit [Actinokineospora bangkokensis]OLR95200.1 hypothetical protein BJP25_07855 [Actinokineospora bangkokensis]
MLPRRPRTRLGALLAALLAVAALTSACDTTFPGTRLRFASGGPGGVYNALARGLSAAWEEQLGLAGTDVQETNGSGDNVLRLQSDKADVAISAADVASRAASAQRSDDPRALVALARIYDDYLHVVVRRDSGIETLAALAGKRVAVGTRDSGTRVIADRVLAVAQLQVREVEDNLKSSVLKLRSGEVDAFFWSGGLPTNDVEALARDTPVRLLDLGDLLPQIRRSDPVYNASSIPASTYGTGVAVATLAVPNFLLTTRAVPDELAEQLTRGLFDARDRIIGSNQAVGQQNAVAAARAIDVLPGIETDPVPLHPGALAYYRSADG